MAQPLKPPAEQLPGGTPPARADNGQPPINTSKLTEEERNWVLRAYSERDQYRRDLDSAKADRERLDQELKNRDTLLTTLAQRQLDADPNQRGIVSREHTEPIQTPESRRIEYDPWAPDAQDRLTDEVRRIAREEASAADRAMSDWYLKDRQGFWNAVTQQDSLSIHYAVEWSDLLRRNPDLQISEFQKLIESAPKFGYSLRNAYEGMHPEVARNRVRTEVRAEIEAELAQQTKAPPPAAGYPPVLGMPSAVPRRHIADRPKNYREATARAYEEAGHKLLE